MKDAKTVALEFLQAFWDGDPERGSALCAPDAVWRFQRSVPFPREVPVREAVRLLNDTLIAAFDPD